MERVSALLSPQYLDSYSYVQTNSERFHLNQASALVVFLDHNRLPGLSVCKSHRNINNSSPLNHRYCILIYLSSCKYIFLLQQKSDTSYTSNQHNHSTSNPTLIKAIVSRLFLYTATTSAYFSCCGEFCIFHTSLSTYQWIIYLCVINHHIYLILRT